jgi:5-methyltetrahydropteroyltriglutamate--homocysteine methyltransferase
LKDAAQRRGDGPAAETAYRAILDEEVARAAALQESIGLRAITDGEFGRASWFGFFFERVAGFAVKPSLYSFHDACGHDHAWSTCFAEGRIRRIGDICGEEFLRLRRVTHTGVPKVTMPSPSALHFFRGREAVDPAAYPDIEGFWDDLVEVYRSEIAELGRLGCRYLQLDEVPLAMLCDPAIREQARAQGLDPARLIDTYVAVINRALADRPAGMTIGLHLCRGNFRSRWLAAGGYEPVAETLLGAVEVDAFFLEYDSPRAGDFAPLRFLPKGKFAVLGLVSSKSPGLEAKDALKRRIDEAARHAPFESLCLSPQCGFASVAGGNALGEDDQRRKLELVVETAGEVWG